VELHSAMATALLLNTIGMSIASFTFVRKGLVAWKLVVPMLLDGLVNSAWFEAYVAKVLAPELRPGECANYFRTCGYEPKWTETALKNFTQHS